MAVQEQYCDTVVRVSATALPRHFRQHIISDHTTTSVVPRVIDQFHFECTGGFRLGVRRRWTDEAVDIAEDAILMRQWIAYLFNIDIRLMSSLACKIHVLIIRWLQMVKNARDLFKYFHCRWNVNLVVGRRSRRHRSYWRWTMQGSKCESPKHC